MERAPVDIAMATASDRVSSFWDNFAREVTRRVGSTIVQLSSGQSTSIIIMIYISRINVQFSLSLIGIGVGLSSCWNHSVDSYLLQEIKRRPTGGLETAGEACTENKL